MSAAFIKVWQRTLFSFKQKMHYVYSHSNSLIHDLIQRLLFQCSFSGIGNDATKALFNFGFCFTVTIAFMYIPLMPVLLQFPLEVQLLKREHFNRWFRIGPYYLAMTAAKLPMQIFLAFAYITMIYIMSDQPLEYTRMAMFYSIAVLIALTSESLGVLISSRLSLIVSVFFLHSFLVLFAVAVVYSLILFLVTARYN